LLPLLDDDDEEDELGSSGFRSKGETDGHESRFAGMFTVAFGLKLYFFCHSLLNGLSMM
jgi:hypothetical protein